MRKVFLFLLVGIATLSSSLGYSVVDGTVLKIDLSKDKLVVAKTNPGEAKSLLDLINSVGGVAGMNGAYFCPAEPGYKRCGSSNDSNFERIIKGKLYGLYQDDTGTRAIMGVTENNEALFVQNNHGYVGTYKNNTNKDRFNDMYYGIANFPILLDNGKNVISFYEKELDAKMKAKQSKGFICHTQDGKTMYMGNIPGKTIYEMPDYLKNKYGCWNAINLDAGGSSAVYGNEKYLVGPGRNIVDAFVVIEKHDEEKDNEDKDKKIENQKSCSVNTLDKKFKLLAPQVIQVLKKKTLSEQQKFKSIIQGMLHSKRLKLEVKKLLEYIICNIG